MTTCTENQTAPQTAGLACYYSEMGQPRPADAVIDAQLAHYGKHYFLTTRLVLKGRGIEHLKTLTAADLAPTVKAQEMIGCHEYKVTIKAFEQICRQYRVAYEMLLD